MCSKSNNAVCSKHLIKTRISSKENFELQNAGKYYSRKQITLQMSLQVTKTFTDFKHKGKSLQSLVSVTKTTTNFKLRLFRVLSKNRHPEKHHCTFFTTKVRTVISWLRKTVSCDHGESHAQMSIRSLTSWFNLSIHRMAQNMRLVEPLNQSFSQLTSYLLEATPPPIQSWKKITFFLTETICLNLPSCMTVKDYYTSQSHNTTFLLKFTANLLSFL